MFCKNCGTDVTGMVYCPVCGAKVADEEKDNASTTQVKEESKFDHFMYKTFFANGKISYEDAEKGFVIGIIALQILQMVLMIFGITLSVLSVCTLLFVLLDWYSLSKRGIRGAWKIWGIFVTPVYLLIRTRKANGKYVVPIISFVCVIISIILILFGNNNAGKGTALAREEAYRMGAMIKLSGSVPSTEIVFMDSWTYENYSVEVYGLPSMDRTGNLDGKFLIAVIERSDGEWKYLNMSTRFNALHEFTKEELVRFREECEACIM